jgi:hypothetical protein
MTSGGNALQSINEEQIRRVYEQWHEMIVARDLPGWLRSTAKTRSSGDPGGEQTYLIESMDVEHGLIVHWRQSSAPWIDKLVAIPSHERD